MNAARFVLEHWKDVVEVVILWAAIYYAWIFFKGTRGAKVLTGLAMFVLGISLLSEFFDFEVIGWLFSNLSTFIVFALVVIFQPELRRALAALGTNRLFASVYQSPESADVLTEATFELANRQLGALIAVERDTNIEPFAESGVNVDSRFSRELLVSLFLPKAPLHDGGVIVRNDRIVAAACIFPVSQRVDIDRTLGTRHRAALGLSEDSDAVVIAVSEETGIVSICYRGRIERNFDPETFRQRISELLLLDKNEKAPNAVSPSLVGQDRFARHRDHPLDGDQTEHSKDKLAF
ncbi:MAG: diadenylate cyclase CdaA [Verrucomicrobiota bacterium]|nr:diadenylate cyclase CdaA [Verrucomicrobiota bacterium]